MTNTEFEDIGTSGSATARRSKKKRRPVLIAALVVLGLVLAGVLGVVGIYGKTVNDALTSVERDPNLLPDTDDAAMVPPEEFAEVPVEGESGEPKPTADPSGKGDEKAPSSEPSGEPSENPSAPPKESAKPDEKAPKGNPAEPNPTGEPEPDPETLDDDPDAEFKAAAPDDPAAVDVPVPYDGAIPNTGALNVLLLGTDSRGSDRGRSDVFMLVHVSADRSRVDLISLPRDYWVAIPGKGTAKINAAYSWGGAPLAVRTVENLMGINIDHVALTNFQGYMNAIDALGGVTVHNRVASSAHGYTWPAGPVRLKSGHEAMVFVRQRYTLPRGDFDRNERQRAVIKAVAKEFISSGVLTDPGKMSNILNTVGSNFTVDGGLSNDKIISLGSELARAGGARNVVSSMAPTAGFGRSRGGQSYVRVDRGGLSNLGDNLRNDRMG